LRRGAAGFFGRASPSEAVVFSTEVDALINAPAGAGANAGVVGMLEADYQPVQGLHLMGTAELKSETGGTSVGGWVGAWWFFLPHFDLRVDGIEQTIATPGNRTLVTTFLAQLHAFL
jgi:hypothetical protein